MFVASNREFLNKELPKLSEKGIESKKIFLDTVEAAVKNLLDIASAKYFIEEDVVNKEYSKLENIFVDIKKELQIEIENQTDQYMDEIVREAIPEMRNKLKLFNETRSKLLKREAKDINMKQIIATRSKL